MTALLICAHNFPPLRGGVERFGDALARYVAPRDTTVVAATHPGAAAHDGTAPYEVIRREMVGRRPPRWLPARKAIDAAITETRPRALLALEWWPHARSLRLIRNRGETRGVLVHGTEIGRSLAQASTRRALTAALRGCDVVIANSEFTASLVRPVAEAVVIHPGVELPSARSESDIVRRLGLRDRLIVLTVARLVPRKGQLRFTPHWERVSGVVPDSTWVIVGDGPDRQALEAATAGARSVVVTGELPDGDIQALYEAAALHLLPGAEVDGHFEGFGMVVVEAGAHGTPTLATDVGGTKEAVEQGGVIVAPDNDDLLADALVELLNDGARRLALGNLARAHAESLAWPLVAARVREALRL